MNRLLLAVAGGRKTQSIIDQCANAPAARRVLVLGYTQASQQELEDRIKARIPFGSHVEVCGWYAFLLRNFVRPYLPLKFPGRRLRGFNFDGEPLGGRYATGESRFLDDEDCAFRLHLSKLAREVSAASNGAVIDRLEHIYHEIHIDEVQDLCGSDLDIIEALFRSKIDVHLVGDIRQALLATNVQDPRYRQYRFDKVINWFRLMERRGLLEIEERPVTYRSNQIIASFSDSVFSADFGYAPTRSEATSATGHDGCFAVAPQHVQTYVAKYEPLCLRHSANSARQVDLPFITFGTCKGRTVERVLIYPTQKIRDFLRTSEPLEGKTACGLYVGVTRARHSVAFVLEPSDQHGLEVWTPAVDAAP